MLYAIFVAFDVETLGLNHLKDDIVEVAGVKFTFEKNGEELKIKVLETFSSFTKPTRFIPKEATAIHGITNDMVEDAPPIDVVLKKFFRFCGLNSILLAHNALFDVRFISKAITDYKLLTPRLPVIDNLKFTRKLMPEVPSHKLGQLAQVLEGQIDIQVDSDALHRALYDCEVLKEVFGVCVKKRFAEEELRMNRISDSLLKIQGSFLWFGKV